MNIFILISQETGSTDYAIHSYSTDIAEAKKTLRKLAFDDLKTRLGKKINDRFECPLNDSVPISQISAGTMTIRHDEKNDRAINLYNIGNNFVFPGKNITIAKVFKILEIEPISTFTSIQNEVGTTTDEEEDDDDQE